MKRLTMLLLAGAFLAGFCALTFGEEPTVDKTRHPWAKFEEGASVKTTTTTKMVIPGVDMPPQTSSTTTTLKEITEKAVTLVIENEVAGEINESTQEVPFKNPDATWEKKGTEEIEAAGKKFSCEVWMMTMKMAGGKTVITSWISKDVQGGVVKTKGEMEFSGMKTTTEMLLTKQGEAVKVKDAEVKCDVFESTMTSDMGETKTTTYTSESVPGFMVRMVAKGKMGGTETETTMEVEEYEVK